MKRRVNWRTGFLENLLNLLVVVVSHCMLSRLVLCRRHSVACAGYERHGTPAPWWRPRRGRARWRSHRRGALRSERAWPRFATWAVAFGKPLGLFLVFRAREDDPSWAQRQVLPAGCVQVSSAEVVNGKISCDSIRPGLKVPIN